MIRRLNAAELERILARYRKQLAKTNGTGGDELARIGVRVEKRIVRSMLAGSGEVTDEQLQAFQRAIRQSVAMGDVGFRETIDRYVPDVWQTALERTADVAGMSVFEPRIADRVLEVVDNFDRSIADRSILRTSDGYTDLWRQQWNDEWTKAARVIQSKFTAATITGEPWQTVASGLTDELGALKIAGRVNPEDFARAFVRTKFGELYVDAGIAIGREAGLEKFINVGVPDDRQSEECFNACNRPPMTLEEWNDTDEGQPKRHVFNCRCDLVAVPDDVEWPGQSNPKFEKQEVAA